MGRCESENLRALWSNLHQLSSCSFLVLSMHDPRAPSGILFWFLCRKAIERPSIHHTCTIRVNRGCQVKRITTHDLLPDRKLSKVLVLWLRWCILPTHLITSTKICDQPGRRFEDGAADLNLMNYLAIRWTRSSGVWWWLVGTPPPSQPLFQLQRGIKN